MFKPGSNQRDYTLCSQYDDALDLPEIPTLADDASPEDNKARDAIAADRAQKLKVAYDRGDWATLIKVGRTPTFFHFRHIPGTALDYWQGQSEKIGSVEQQALLFRLALKSVEHLGQFKVEHEDVGDQRIVSIKSMDELYAIGDGIGRKVVGELASIIAAKTFRGVGPLC